MERAYDLDSQLSCTGSNDDAASPNLDIIERDKPLDAGLRVLFIGGGNKDGFDQAQEPVPRYLRDHFKHFSMAVARHTSDFEVCVRTHAQQLAAFRPDVVVAHSRGGPTALTLIQRGFWRGPTLLMCPAVVPGLDDAICHLRTDAPVLVLAGAQDEHVPLRYLESLWAQNESKLQDGFQVLVVRDCHALITVLDDDCPKQYELMGFRHRPLTTTETLTSFGDNSGTSKQVGNCAVTSHLPLGLAAASYGCTLYELVYECWAMRLRTVQNYEHEDRFLNLREPPGRSIQSDSHHGGPPLSLWSWLQGCLWVFMKSRMAMRRDAVSEARHCA